GRTAAIELAESRVAVVAAAVIAAVTANQARNRKIVRPQNPSHAGKIDRKRQSRRTNHQQLAAINHQRPEMETNPAKNRRIAHRTSQQLLRSRRQNKSAVSNAYSE